MQERSLQIGESEFKVRSIKGKVGQKEYVSKLLCPQIESQQRLYVSIVFRDEESFAKAKREDT
jgi:hypothetical protein